jgi:ribonuclease E
MRPRKRPCAPATTRTRTMTTSRSRSNGSMTTVAARRSDAAEDYGADGEENDADGNACTPRPTSAGGDDSNAVESLRQKPDEPAPPLQDSGRDPAPPGAARPGREGRARQQGRGADDLSQPCRSLLRADAQHVSHGGGISRKISQCGRSQAPEVDPVRAEPADARWAASSAPPASSARKQEIKRDFDYLARLWDEIREKTLDIGGARRNLSRQRSRSSAPSAISTTRISTR